MMACVFVYSATAGLQYGKAAFWIMVILKYDVVGPWSCWDDDKRKEKLRTYIYDYRPCLLLSCTTLPLICTIWWRYWRPLFGISKTKSIPYFDPNHGDRKRCSGANSSDRGRNNQESSEKCPKDRRLGPRKDQTDPLMFFPFASKTKRWHKIRASSGKNAIKVVIKKTWKLPKIT